MKTQKYLLVLVGAASISSAAYSTDLNQIKNEAVEKAEQVADFAKVLADKKFEKVTTYLKANKGYVFTPDALKAIVNALESAQAFVHEKLAGIDFSSAGLPEQVVAGLEAAKEFSGNKMDLQAVVNALSTIKLNPNDFAKFTEMLGDASSKIDLSEIKEAVKNLQENKAAFAAAVEDLRAARADKIPGLMVTLVQEWADKKGTKEWANIEEKWVGKGLAYATRLQANSGNFAKVLESFAKFAVSVANLAGQVVSVYGPIIADAVPAQEKAQINKAVMFVKDRFGDVKEKVSPVINKVKNVVSSLR